MGTSVSSTTPCGAPRPDAESSWMRWRLSLPQAKPRHPAIEEAEAAQALPLGQEAHMGDSG
jgi:hypothetical protein